MCNYSKPREYSVKFDFCHKIITSFLIEKYNYSFVQYRSKKTFCLKH